MSKKIVQRLGAALGVTVIGAVALIGVSPAAMAAPAAGDYGNIDFDREGSLTVHKFLHQAGTKVGDPSTAPADGEFTDPVEDVVFTAYPLLKGAAPGIPVDLSVPASWTGLDALVPGAACTAPAGYTKGAGVDLPSTSSTGVATTLLNIGLYMVCETAAPADIVDRALPFIVTIPLPHGNGWVYDVHTYPKNGKGSITKSIEDQQQNTGLGSIVKFPVTAPIPTMADQWTGFAITDTLDPRLAVEGNGVASVTLDGGALNPSYYDVTADPTNAQKVIVKFNAAGVAWLNTAPGNVQAGKKIVVTFQGKVVTVGNGTIPNTADLWVNNPNLDSNTKPPVPSNEVKTNWGALAVQKRAAGTTGTTGTLNGAVFEVYNAVAPYPTNDATCTNAVQDGSAISVNGQTQFTSAGTGVISIPGLFVSDSVNPVINAAQRCYVLVEVAAPAGYVLPANPATPVAVKIGQTTISDNVEILNTQQEVPQLPLTGAAGQVLLIAIGSGAILLAVILLVVNRRRSTVRQ